MTELINPCAMCDHHLAGGDKNDDRCKNCSDRVSYVKAIGDMTESLAMEMIMDGHGGTKIPERRTEENTKSEPPPEVHIEPEILQAIHQVCTANGVEFEEIRLNTKRRTKPQNIAVNQIIAMLYKDHKLQQRRIAEILNCSQMTISTRLKKLESKPEIVDERIVPRQFSEIIQSDDDMLIEWIFTGYPDEHKLLHDFAKKEVRTVRQQLIYIVRDYMASNLKKI